LNGGIILEKDFERFVAMRCETALLESEEYLNLERGECDSDTLQEIAETICYKKGFEDAMKIMKIG
jgi:hypothetical protein